MSQAFHLLQLQKIDSQLDQIESRAQEINALLSNHSEVETAQRLLQQADTVFKQKQQALRKIEQEAQAKRIKLEQSEENLYSGRVKIPKELRDLENEVQALKRALSALEDRQLEAMIELEQAETEYRQAELQVQRALATETEQHASLRGELENLLRNRDRLLREREVILNQIEPSNQVIYQQLRERKRGIAVATVEDDTCSACGSTLTPAERQAARFPHQLVFCSSCGRILYAG